MAVSAGMALLSTGMGLATGGTLAFGSTLGFLGLGAAASHFLVTTALGAALNALTPRPSGPRGGYQRNFKSAAADHAIIYGESKVGGVPVFEESTGTNNRHFHQVIAYAGHEIEDFTTVYFDDDELIVDVDGNVSSPSRYNNKVRINFHLGDPNQAADSDLVSEVSNWTTDHRLRGVAYLYIRYSYNADAFPNGLPEVTVKIKGKKLYDPRTGLTEWSDNPALAIRDYLTSSYGLNEEDARVDDASVSTAANVCDELAANGEKKFTCNGSFLTSTTPYDNFISLLSSMGGLMWFSQGKWKVKPAYWVSPVTDYGVGDLRGPISVATRHSRRNNYNTVKGTFRGEETNWQTTDYPEVTNSAFISADNGQESVVNVDLPFTDNYEEARRIARINLERNRQQLSVSITTSLKGLQNQVGDNIRLTVDRYGWSNKEFEVVAWTLSLTEELALVVNMELRETSESIFDEVDDGAVYERDNSTLPSPFDVPPVGISLEAVARILGEKLVNSLVVNVTSSRSQEVDFVEVQLKPSTESNWVAVGTGELGVFGVDDLVRAEFDVRARAVNSFGNRGEWTTYYNFEVDALSDPPQDVANFSYTFSGTVLFLSWDAVSDLDLSYYQIRKNSATSGATWGNSNILVEKVARPATTVTVPLTSGTYLIKAFDKGGNQSNSETTLTISPSEIPSFGVSQTLTENPTFSGTDSNTITDTSTTPDTLIINNRVSPSPPEGTYVFSTYIDTTTSGTRYAEGQVKFTRYQDNVGTWDNIPQNFDTWPDTFDNWTDEGISWGDNSVTFEVRATDDDPSGSPTWGSWQPMSGGSLVGRAFEFRAILAATNDNVSPRIEELSATISY